MPSIAELISHSETVLGPRSRGLSATGVIQELRLSGAPRLADELEQAVETRSQPAPPSGSRGDEVGEVIRVRLPQRFSVQPPDDFLAVPSSIYDPVMRRYVARDGHAAAAERLDWQQPYQPSQRKPLTEPTSTTTIGAAEAIDPDYAALVAELGLNSAAVDLETFKALVPRAGLHVYHRGEVQEYLHCQYKVPVGDLTPLVVWGWRPLRAVDRVAGSFIGFNGKVQRSAPVYAKPIPYPVLLTVKTVHDACPSAGFFVSDELQGERIPDPFLLVEIADEAFVIERWDEPAFRAKK